MVMLEVEGADGGGGLKVSEVLEVLGELFQGSSVCLTAL
jgi:hypothetical protein